MVTKGIITSIDFLTNTCKVRIPLFETAAAHTDVETEAIFSIQPGQYNGYKVDDVVEIAFEDGNAGKPVVIGKLYLGANEEGKDSRGANAVETLVVTKKATLPLDTQISFEGNEANVAKAKGGYSSYNKLSDVLDGLQQNTEQLSDAQVQLISTNDELRAKVSKTSDGATTGFGWDLQADKWTVFNTEQEAGGTVVKSKDILVADKDGLYVDGKLVVREESTIAGFDVGTRAIYSHLTDDSLINEKMKELATDIENATTAAERKEKIDPTTNPIDGLTGTYVGTDGIRIGNAFSVDSTGQVTASGLKIKLTPEQIEQLKFKITKVYPSIQAMIDDWYATEEEARAAHPEAGYIYVKTSEFVSIDAGEWEEETGYTYSKNATKTKGTGERDEEGWTYITDMAGIGGISPTIYRVECNSVIHLGNKQIAPITAAAWSKTGTEEIHDTTADFKISGIKCIIGGVDKWDSTKVISEQSEEVISSGVIERLSDDEGSTYYGFKIPLSTISNSATNIDITAFHKNTGGEWTSYDSQTVTYSPLNTPVIALTNSNASIAYNGNSKLGENVSTTAKLVYNGAEKTPTSITWTLEHLTAASELSNSTITISEIENNIKQGTASVVMTWADESGRVWNIGPTVFNVSKQLQGETGGPALYIDNDNDFDSVPADYDGTISTSYQWETQTKHSLKIYEGITQKQFTAGSGAAPVSGLYIKYPDLSNDSSNVRYYSGYPNLVDNNKLEIAVTLANGQTKIENNKKVIAYEIYNDGALILATKFELSVLLTGKPNVDHFINASATAFNKNKNDQVTPATINLIAKSQIGFSAAVTMDKNDCYWGYKIGSMSEQYFDATTNTLSINPESGTSSAPNVYVNGQTAIITLYTDSSHNNRYDAETISFIVDGTDGTSISIKGTVANYTALIAITGQVVGDSYTVENASDDPQIGSKEYLGVLYTYSTNNTWEYCGQFKGKDAASIVSVTPWYYRGSSMPSQPTEASHIGWSETPQEFVDGEKYYTSTRTVYSSGTPTWSTVVENKELNNCYALVQGKSTNYYSETDPSIAPLSKTIKFGDCWFDTGYHSVSGSTSWTDKHQYIGYYVILSGSTYTLITSSNYSRVSLGSQAYTKNILKQCTGFDSEGHPEWTEVSNEMIANKVTANFINAMDITAKKIDIIQSNNEHLFTADGTVSTPYVNIAGFSVKNNTLESGTSGTNEYVHIGTDKIALGNNAFTIDNAGEIYSKSGIIGGFEIDETSLSAGENATKVCLAANSRARCTVCSLDASSALQTTWSTWKYVNYQWVATAEEPEKELTVLETFESVPKPYFKIRYHMNGTVYKVSTTCDLSKLKLSKDSNYIELNMRANASVQIKLQFMHSETGIYATCTLPARTSSETGWYNIKLPIEDAANTWRVNYGGVDYTVAQIKAALGWTSAQLIENVSKLNIFSVICSKTSTETPDYDYIDFNPVIFAKDSTVTSVTTAAIAVSEIDILEFTSIYTGSETAANAPFRVTNTGKLFANQANITGAINATSGNIGGCIIEGGSLQVNAANITGQLTAEHIKASDLTVNKLLVNDAEGNALLDAGASSTNTVNIGKFRVGKFSVRRPKIPGGIFIGTVQNPIIVAESAGVLGYTDGINFSTYLSDNSVVAKSIISDSLGGLVANYSFTYPIDYPEHAGSVFRHYSTGISGGEIAWNIFDYEDEERTTLLGENTDLNYLSFRESIRVATLVTSSQASPEYPYEKLGDNYPFAGPFKMSFGKITTTGAGRYWIYGGGSTGMRIVSAVATLENRNGIIQANYACSIEVLNSQQVYVIVNASTPTVIHFAVFGY